MKKANSMLGLLMMVANLQPTVVFLIKGYQIDIRAFIPETPEEVKVLRDNAVLAKDRNGGIASLNARETIQVLTGIPIAPSMYSSETEFYDLYPERLGAFPPE